MSNNCALTVPFFLLSLGTNFLVPLLSVEGSGRIVLLGCWFVFYCLGFGWLYGGLATRFPALATLLVSLASNPSTWYAMFLLVLFATVGVQLIKHYLDNRVDVSPVLPQMAILRPLERARVGMFHTVRGSVNLQVFIFSRDRRWHAQTPMTLKWRTKCQFGLEDAPGGTEYGIVAISGAPPQADALEPQRLPKGIAQSFQVNVTRK